MGNTTSAVLDNIVQGSNCQPLPRLFAAHGSMVLMSACS